MSSIGEISTELLVTDICATNLRLRNLPKLVCLKNRVTPYFAHMYFQKCHSFNVFVLNVQCWTPISVLVPCSEMFSKINWVSIVSFFF